MASYSLLRPLLFQLDAEKAHHLAISALRFGLYPWCNSRQNFPNLHQTIAGIDFENPIGLGAGFDKNAECIPALWKAGFGFLEVGTVTPKPQAGNPKPRLFRLESDQAIINRLGFNNKGENEFKRNINNCLQASENKRIFGINIGKNKTTEDPVSDYLHLLHEVCNLSAYITINISSPNTPGLRSIQSAEMLDDFLGKISKVSNQLQVEHAKRTPLFLKIAPDVSMEELRDICTLSLSHGLDGLIITNTTLSRPANLKSRHKYEAGGLSGRPLSALSTETLRQAYRFTEGKIPLIGVGGVSSAEDAWEKIAAGASLVQIYSALIYQGLEMVPKVIQALSERVEREGFANISEVIGKSS
jgi:dihydroorotate dehydrogenase